MILKKLDQSVLLPVVFNSRVVHDDHHPNDLDAVNSDGLNRVNLLLGHTNTSYMKLRNFAICDFTDIKSHLGHCLTMPMQEPRSRDLL